MTQWGGSAYSDWRWPNLLNPFKSTHWSWAGSLASAAIVLIWITVQVLMIRQAAFLHYLYWGWGGKLWLLTSLAGVCHYYKLES